MSGRRWFHRRLTPHSSILERDPVDSRLQAYRRVGRNKPSALRHSCLAESPTASDSTAKPRHRIGTHHERLITCHVTPLRSPPNNADAASDEVAINDDRRILHPSCTGGFRVGLHDELGVGGAVVEPRHAMAGNNL